VELHDTDDVEEYAAAVTAFLEADPCARNVPYTVMQLVQQGATTQWAAAPGFWWITDDTGVAGAALWTPPYPLLVTSVPDAAWPLLADSALQRAERIGAALRGVNGPGTSARGVATAVAARTGMRARVAKVMWLQQTAQALEVPHPSGHRERASTANVDLLGAWLTAFGEEVDEPIGADGPGQARRMVAAGMLDVWIDAGAPVSLSGYRGPHAGVVRVGPVYTPPEHRNRGYARQLVRAITAAQLARDGVRWCMLFADAANSVSNSIYAQIGYRTVAEHVEMRLLRPSALAGGGEDPPR
jgi:predicted GNAT family acetyltransferase